MRNKMLVALGLTLVIILIFVGISLAYAAVENVADAACDTLSGSYPVSLADPYPTPIPSECNYLPVIKR